MTKKIEIRNLKNISRLRFAIPDPGVYLLTGNNGSGKTSLLTCLHRIGMSNAFQVNFRTSSHATLDSFLDAEIKYENTGKSVVYKYSGERWAPTPKSHSDLLRSCNFPTVLYIAADGTRIDPRKEEFEPRRVRLSSQPVRDALKDIFKTRKFDELCYINIQRGVGHKAYLIRHRNSQGNPQYFSEKNFSLGEVCVLRLVLSLTDCKPKSLILIDELELALHPKAKVSLFRYIERIAKEKELTVLFSTHSVSLVKTAERKQILFLDDSSGNVECISGCYPAQVLGHLAFGEEAAPDIVILVEDNHAKYCLNALLRLYEEISLAGRPKPTIAVAPLGGFIQILHFLDSAPTLLPIKTKVLGFLDQDVKQESLVAYQAQENHTVLAMFLPCLIGWQLKLVICLGHLNWVFVICLRVT